MRGFVMGFICGAGLLYGAMSFHVVMAKDGLHVIPKASAALKDTYVDIREFGFTEWKDHPELAASLVKADRADLMQSSAVDSIHRSLDGLLSKEPS